MRYDDARYYFPLRDVYLRYRSLLTVMIVLLSGCGGSSSQVPNGPLTLAREVIASDLNLPASIAFAPDGRLFFSEFVSGEVKVIQVATQDGEPRGNARSSSLYVTSKARGNEGLTGITIDPLFSENHYLYLFHSDPVKRKSSVTRITELDGRGTAPVTVIDNIPASGHNGGRLVFGPDNDSLFVSTGDVGEPALAQDDASLAGKILRINVRTPPFTAEVFAKGFRNVFGMALREPTGELYCSDNGPSCDDEINRVTPGGNYGWRAAQPCGDADGGFAQPIVRYSQRVAPTGIAFYDHSAIPALNGELLVADFNTGYLRAYLLDESTGAVIGEGAPLISGEYGSLIDVAVSPDGSLYVATMSSIVRLS